MVGFDYHEFPGSVRRYLRRVGVEGTRLKLAGMEGTDKKAKAASTTQEEDAVEAAADGDGEMEMKVKATASQQETTPTQ